MENGSPEQFYAVKRHNAVRLRRQLEAAYATLDQLLKLERQVPGAEMEVLLEVRAPLSQAMQVASNLTEETEAMLGYAR